MAVNFLNNNNQTNFTNDFNKKLTDDNPLGLKKKKPLIGGAPQQAIKPAPVTQTLDQVLGKTQKPALPTKGLGDMLQPSRKPFDISQTELFKKSAAATGRQLAGEVPGMTEQEKIARENLAVAEAKSQKKIREDLTTQGFRDTGKFVEEGILEPEEQRLRRRRDLERQLIADRAPATQQAVTQGQAATQGLLGMMQAGEAQEADIAATERADALKAQLAREGITSTEKIATQGIASDETLAKLNIGAQESILRIKDELDTGRLMLAQDFEGAQNELAQEHALAIQNNDLTAKKEIEDMQANLQLVMQEKQQEYADAQRVATQSWQTGERLGEQDFVNAENFLQREQETALQNNDIEAQLKIAKDRNMLQLKLQTNDMTHDEKMVNLNAQLEEAKADNDVGRQKDIMSFAHTQEMDRILQEQGFEESMAYVNNELAQALQNNDFTNSKALMEIRHQQELKIHNDNLALEQARVDLQEAGIDMAQIEQQYQFLQNEVANGRLDPSVATNFIKDALGEKLPVGFQFTEPDPNAVQDAMAADWVNQQYQYALQQGDADGDGKLDAGIYETDANGNNIFVGLADEHSEKFNNHMNETIYGTDTSPSLGGSDIKDKNTRVDGDFFMEGGKMYKVSNGGDKTDMHADDYALILRNASMPNNKNNSIYTDLLNNANAPDISIDSRSNNTIRGVPGAGTVVKIGDRLMVVTVGKYRSKTGRNHDEFEIMDISTGSKKTFTGLNKKDSVGGMGGWADGLSG